MIHVLTKGHRVITHNFDAAAPFPAMSIDCQIEYWQALRQNTENELTQLRAGKSRRQGGDDTTLASRVESCHAGGSSTVFMS
jgi:hypothetical protein